MIKPIMAEMPKSLETEFLKSNFEKASQLLIENKGYYSEGQFHYNLGTVYSKLKNYAAGRYHFEKAIKVGYVNSKVLYNLNTTKNILSVQDLQSSPNVSDQFLNVALAVPGQLYFTLTLSIVLIALVLWIRKTIKTLKVGLITGVLGMIPFLFYSVYLSDIKFGINIKETTLREGPSSIFQEMSVIRPGSKFIIGRIYNGWFFIERPLPMSGWIKGEDVGLL